MAWQPKTMTLTTARDAYRLAFLRVSVQNEMDRLDRTHGEMNAPIGGWRNRAVEYVASREGMNPYSLDRLLRGV